MLGEATESAYLTWKSEQHRLTPNYKILCSLVPLVKYYFATMEEADNQLKITCQHCNGFVICKGRSTELVYITFLHSGLSIIGIYPDELVQESFYFQCNSRTKMQRMYQMILKEGNDDYTYLRRQYLGDNNFEVVFSEISLDKLDVDCAENIEAKPIRNDSGLITYSKRNIC